MGPPAIPERVMINYYHPKDFKIKILLWNCRGANNPNFFKALRGLLSQYKTNMLILTEIRAGGDRALAIYIDILFDHFVAFKTRGHFGSI